MSFSPVPKYMFSTTTDISAEFLQKLGIDFLMLDLDNTLARYGENTLREDTASWAKSLQESGISLFIVSNSHRHARVSAFAKALGVDYVNAAGKPSPSGVLRAMEISEMDKRSSALIGDQVYTDGLAANRSGVISIVVRPLKLKNPLLALRYFLELPFRAVCKNKMWGK